jgi:hypothetical protein
VIPYEFPRKEVISIYGKRDKNTYKTTKSYDRSVKKGHKFGERYSRKHNKKIK